LIYQHEIDEFKKLTDIELQQKREELIKSIDKARDRYDWNAYQEYYRLFCLANIAKYTK
jgi:hypothetical protein